MFEGRDAAGKGGTIKRFMEHLNPRGARIVALEKPTARESSQWYFQRYIAHLPSAGEIVLFDRSWYNRAVVERVMGFCTDEQYREFLRQAPRFEEMLTRSGILLVKLWFSVSRSEQHTRFLIRQIDPVRQWKLSPTDLKSLDHWDDYTEAKEAMFFYTDTDHAPWVVVKSNDKKRARLAAMRHVLSLYDYDEKDTELVDEPDPLILGPASRIFEQGEAVGRQFPPLDRWGPAGPKRRRDPRPSPGPRRAAAAAHPRPATGVAERVVVDGTFGLYLGWVAVATCANVTAALVASGVRPSDAVSDALAVVVLLVAAALGVVFARTLSGRWAVASRWPGAGLDRGRTHHGSPPSLVVALFAAVAALVVLAVVPWARQRSPQPAPAR